MKKDRKINVSFTGGIILFVILTLLAIYGLSIHEPWFDEAQAYLIGRDASLHDILFLLPHYEGHPPLWHLILKFINIFNMPYELSLKLTQFFFFELALFLLEFKSPFNIWLKLLLPMNYFFIYQYCVVSRPYAMFMCSFFLAAICYKNRFEKPFLYMLCLLFMCLCHAYGIAMAGGLIVSDIINMWIAEKSFSALFKKIISNKKMFLSYIILLISAILLIIQISPKENTYAVNNHEENSYFKNLFLTWFLIPSENFFSSSYLPFSILSNVSFTFSCLYDTTVISLIVWSFLFVICKKRKKLIVMFVPYSFTSLVLAYYTFFNHLGIFFLFFVFVVWICYDTEPIYIREFIIPVKNSDIIRKIQYAIVCIAFSSSAIINLEWDYKSYSLDKSSSYYPGRALSEWIKENNYQDSKWLVTWDIENPTMYNGVAITLNTYFDENLFYNMYQDKTYFTHYTPTYQQYMNIIEEIKKYGYPDFIVTSFNNISNLELICKYLDIENDYKIIYSDMNTCVFKDCYKEVGISVFALNDKNK